VLAQVQQGRARLPDQKPVVLDHQLGPRPFLLRQVDGARKAAAEPSGIGRAGVGADLGAFTPVTPFAIVGFGLYWVARDRKVVVEVSIAIRILRPRRTK
jgi:hypothetical protein